MKPHMCGWECMICGYRHKGSSPEAVFKARDKHICDNNLIINKIARDITMKEAQNAENLLKRITVRNKTSKNIELIWEYEGTGGGITKHLVLEVTDKNKKWWEFWK